MLIVEDDRQLREQLGAAFRADGWAVELAPNGREGRYFGTEYPCDIAIVDLGLPGMDGIELASLVLAECPGPAVVLMTGQLSEDIERVNVGGRIVRVLHKPLNLDLLQEFLRALLDTFPPAELESPQQAS